MSPTSQRSNFHFLSFRRFSYKNLNNFSYVYNLYGPSDILCGKVIQQRFTPCGVI